MSKSVEFFYDFVSPAAYLASTQMPGIGERTGARVIYRPFLLGGVFKATGNSAPMTIPAKGAWLLNDLHNFAKRYGVEMKMNPNFPFHTVGLMRGALWAEQKGQLIPYSEAMFRATWVEAKNLVDEAVVAEILKSISLDPSEYAEAIGQQEIKDKLRENTEEAVKRGAFGAPTMFVGDKMFWGQDRLDFVEEALSE